MYSSTMFLCVRNTREKYFYIMFYDCYSVIYRDQLGIPLDLNFDRVVTVYRCDVTCDLDMC